VNLSWVAAAHAGEERMFKWARAALCAYGVVVVGELGSVLTLAGTFRRDIHRFFDQLQTAAPGQPPAPNLNGLYPVSIAVDLGQLVLLGVGIVFLVWQYNAARVARGLGYPARTSPGFGVASWFIPVINLWFPYWALSDCLPPNHPLRPSALWAWLAYLATGLLMSATFLVAFFSGYAAIIPLVPALISLAAAVALGYRLITAVNNDQRGAFQGKPR
jgi:hypothetical protein